ncbi:MAG: nitroreductase/quinone reductase family protein [Solirubrobacteraceae bacterium]
MGVPAIDPRRSTRLLRALARFARSPAGRWFGIHIAARIDPMLLRLSGGRVSSFAGAPVLNLTVPGRRSGEPRSSALLYFTEGEEAVLIASSFGREKHPAWYYNVMAHPEVTLAARGAQGRYVAREVVGEERDRLYGLATLIYPGYADYEARAASAGRKIPVLALRPA